MTVELLTEEADAPCQIVYRGHVGAEPFQRVLNRRSYSDFWVGECTVKVKKDGFYHRIRLTGQRPLGIVFCRCCLLVTCMFPRRPSRSF